MAKTNQEKFDEGYHILGGGQQITYLRLAAKIHGETIATKADLRATNGLISSMDAKVSNLVTAVAKVAGGEKFDEAKLLAGVNASAEAGAKKGTEQAVAGIQAEIAASVRESIEGLDLGEEIASRVLAAVDSVTTVNFKEVK